MKDFKPANENEVATGINPESIVFIYFFLGGGTAVFSTGPFFEIKCVPNQGHREFLGHGRDSVKTYVGQQEDQGAHDSSR